MARVWGAGKIFRTTLKNVPKRRSAEAASSGFQNQFQDQFPTRPTTRILQESVGVQQPILTSKGSPLPYRSPDVCHIARFKSMCGPAAFYFILPPTGKETKIFPARLGPSTLLYNHGCTLPRGLAAACRETSRSKYFRRKDLWAFFSCFTRRFWGQGMHFAELLPKAPRQTHPEHVGFSLYIEQCRDPAWTAFVTSKPVASCGV